MSKISFVNGKYLNFKDAKISVNDRSIHFSDAVYEVIAVSQSKLVFWKEHYERLKNSLYLVDIRNFNNLQLIFYKCQEIIKLNNIHNGLIYIQISRGSASRNHNWDKNMVPSLVISAQHKNIFKTLAPVSLISNLDIRWKCSHIKSTSLLGNVLLKQKALEQKAFECIMFDNKRFLTEATTSNIWVIKDKKIFTPPLKKNILGGVTRRKIFEIAKFLNIKAFEKEIKFNSLASADGVFLSNSSSLMVLVKKIDNININLDKENIFKLILDKLIKTINKENEQI